MLFPVERLTTSPKVAASLALILLLLLPSIASAQYSIIDRPTGGTSAGAQFDLGVPTDPDQAGDVVLFHNELWGQLTFDNGFGGFITIPVNAVFSGDDNIDDTSGLGNIEISGIYNLELPIVELIFRAGIGIPLAGTDDEARIANVAATLGDPADAILGAPDTFGIRTSASVVADIPLVQLRADVGLDTAIPIEEQEGETRETDILIRANVGATLDIGLLEFLLELANTSVTRGSDFDEGWSHALGFGVAFDLIVVRPRLGVSLPFGRPAGLPGATAQRSSFGDWVFINLAVDVTVFDE